MENTGFWGKFFLVIYSALIGIVSSAVAWGFLSFYNIAFNFMWGHGDNSLYHFAHSRGFEFIKYLPIFFGVIGGLLIGLIHKKFGKIPKGMPEIEKEFYETGQLQRPNLLILFVAATLPLVFGGSVDPEVAIISLVVALTSILINSIPMLKENAEEVTSLGVGSSLAVMFGSPLFGYSIAEKGELSKLKKQKLKSFLYLIAITVGVLTFMVLGNIYNEGIFSIRFPEPIDATGHTRELYGNEYLWLTLFTVIGISLGYIFSILEKAFHWLFHKINKDILVTVFVGLIIGIVSLYSFNDFLVSGAGKSDLYVIEYIINHLSDTGASHAATTQLGGGSVAYDMSHIVWNEFLTLGLLKLTLTALCLAGFWKGGEIFPLMFAGAAIGLYLSHITGVDATASIAVVMGALVSFVTKKPVGIFMLFIFFFPHQTYMPLMVVLIMSNIIPKPHFLDAH